MALDEKDVFLAALALPDGEGREAYLQAACAGHPALLGHVRGLLSAYQGSQGPLDRGPAVQGITADAAPTEGPSSVLGPYKLVEPIGEGGMGTVWMAQQQEPVKRLVAVKLIKAGLDSRQVVARFEAERQALALMDHPNIARVLDGGTAESGRPFFVMDLVKGVPITRYCDEHRLTPRQRLELFLPVCQAVQHAHQKGIIHRDLKPSNVLVALYDGKPVPKVIDFGVAKAAGQQLTEKTLVTGFGNIVGTLEYMSPEQAESNQLDVDTRSDIYSLGVLLYELLAGSPPFTRKDLTQGGVLDMLRMIREQEPTRPSTKLSTAEGLPTLAANRGTEPAKLARLVRGEQDWIVMKALEKDRNRRYETANGFAMDVQRYLADEPVLACPPSAWYRLRKSVRRHRGPVLAAAAVVLALLAGIVGTTRGMVRAIRAEAETASEAKQKETALTAALASEREAQDNLWVSLDEQAQARRFSRQPGQRLDSLGALTRAARIRPDERLRDAAIAALALPDVRPGPPWQCPPSGTNGLAFDAQYRLHARVSEQGYISILSISDNREVRRIDRDQAGESYPYLSPDGSYLAAVEGTSAKLRVWRVADGTEVLRDGLSQVTWWTLTFSPDSRQLAIDRHGWIVRIDLATGLEVNRWPLPGKLSAHQLAFHPDNRRLAVGYRSSNAVSVFDVTSGKPVTDLPVGPSSTDQCVAWHLDGERLAVAGGAVNPGVQIWNVTAKRQVATLKGHVQMVTRLSFHPDGGLLISGSHDGTARVWDPSTGQQFMRLTDVFLQVRFSNDGRWLGVTRRGEHAQLLEVIPSREYRSLSAGPDNGYNQDHDISPNGQLLALNLYFGVCLFHLPSGRELATLPRGRPLFSSNAELLVVGPDGLQRWPIRPGAAANELCLGPPRTIPLPVAPTRAGLSRDGRTLAVVSEQAGAGVVVDLATDSVKPPRPRHPSACYVALSPDGRWVATGGWHSVHVRLWDAATGELANEWAIYQAMVFFTPDSRFLVISQHEEFSFWDVKTRQLVRRVRRDVPHNPGHVCFSPDGRLMALQMAPGVIHLRDAATDRVVAKLEDPHGDHAWWMSFTLDGTQLVVNAPYARAIHVWDLRTIRQRLKGMNLEWDWPEFPPAARDDEPRVQRDEPALRVRVVKAAG
jgi:serine/threonine protein kinase/WD40 repeat protein